MVSLEQRSNTSPPTAVGSFHDAVRLLAQRVPGAAAASVTAPTLEPVEGSREAPRVIDAQVVENATASRPVPGDAVAAFEGFLDGIQQSRVARVVRGVPIVWGQSSAVVRRRVQRRLTTWDAPIVTTRLYAPLAMLDPSARAALADAAVVDTSSAQSAADDASVRHPQNVIESALHAVQRDREAAERTLAERWGSREGGLLMVDGSVAALDLASRGAGVVGVIKTHRQLYATSAILDMLFSLAPGERTPVVRIAPKQRSPVHSWYLRLRPGVPHDALWGIVRVEVAESADPAARADEVSRWVLAERAPVALPDARWDRMMYPVRDCEEYLRAIT